MPVTHRRPYGFGDLYDLIQRHFPEHQSRQRVLDVPRLAYEMGLSHETIYRCVRTGRLTVPVAHTILKYSHERHPENPLFWQDLFPFVLPDFEQFSRP